VEFALKGVVEVLQILLRHQRIWLIALERGKKAKLLAKR
jgi:hypothetical protein